jgi:cytochrome c oxidase subunit III
VSLTVAFGALGTGIVVWFLIVRRLTVRTWEVQGTALPAEPPATGNRAAQTGLAFFLAVVTSLFGLFLSAYYIRMGHSHAVAAAPSDWHPVTEPRILWLNTALLVLGSAAMQWARNLAVRGDAARTRTVLMVAGILTAGFLIGQVTAWRMLADTGYFTPANPAAAFFVVLTALHGLHLLGGLVVWARTSTRLITRRVEVIDARRSVELCALYWHYLLLVWLVLFAVLLAT